MKIPNTSQIILLLIGLNQNKFSGKTNIHKNLYLLKEMLSDISLPFQFRPYFYGPYCEPITESLDILESSGLLTSKEISLGRDDVFEIRQSIYELTPTGEKALDRINTSFPEFVSMFKQRFDTIRKTGFHQHTRILSTAAKVKLILSLEKKPLYIDNIKEKAKKLGWEIEPKDIESSIEVLEKTGLARKVGQIQ